ncbi:MAG: transcriptional repressor [Bacteroidales bacterium]|nr:transcriptional repressor [Bacteroidales bacterium]
MKQIHLEISSRLSEKGLKITPQRIAVYEAVKILNNHPTAEKINEYIKKNHPHISVATVYKILELFCQNNILNKVKTDADYMRYELVINHHHHLYCLESERIEDFFDNELDKLIEEYFKTKNIPGFEVDNIKLQIIGKFINQKN